VSWDADQQARLREFLARHATAPSHDFGDEAASVEEARTFQRALFDAGLAGPNWPRRFGGLELPPGGQAAYAAELDEVSIPISPLTLGLNVCGPAVIEFGTPDQRERHGRATLRGDEVWCQLWSEPEAGSDLAGLRTKATPAGDGWNISGTKIWTSGAHYSDYGLLLARTEPEEPRHRGLSMFIIKMDMPGITVRPVRQMTGDSEFNEVFLDDVILPADALLGERAAGWRVVTWMMGQERTSVGMQLRHPLMLEWADVRRLVAEMGGEHERDPLVRAQLAALHVRQRAATLLNARIQEEAVAGGGSASLGSAAKVAEGAVMRDAAELACAAMGAPAWSGEDAARAIAAGAALQSPGLAIGGGTDEIQLNTLGERVLGLPR
jgi:alkylation response protein AidB-like acyl-CoA dehydrogenase